MWTEPILHVDMDAFFVEVERLRDETLRNRPVAVGGVGRRGVIASASYEARAFGVRSAQPTAIARRLCRELVVVSPGHGRYGEMSEMVFAVFRSFTPYVEGLSLDEAFLDITGLRRHYESPIDVARDIRATIATDLGLPASVGIAATKFVAKLASEVAKPDGYRHVPADVQLQFLHALPVDALWGVGPATLAGLTRLGVITVGDLAEIPEPTVTSSLGPTVGRHLIDLANGIDLRPVQPDSEAKSLSVEETFSSDLRGQDRIEAALLGHSQRLSGRLRRSGVAAETISIKVRFDDFTTLTRTVTPGVAVDSPRDLFFVGKQLLGEVDLSRPVRLLGLGGASLVAASTPRQMRMDSNEQWDRIADAVSGVRERFGEHAVDPARLVDMETEDLEPDR